MRRFFGLCFIWLLLLSPLLFSVSIIPSPYYQYEVSGKVLRDGGKSLNDFTVVVLAKLKDNKNFFPSDTIKADYVVTADRPISLTDQDGNFNLVFSSKLTEVDAFRLKILLPLSESFVSEIFYTEGFTMSLIQEKYTYSNESGCNCQSTTSSEMATAGYYHKGNVSPIQLPF